MSSSTSAPVRRRSRALPIAIIAMLVLGASGYLGLRGAKSEQLRAVWSQYVPARDGTRLAVQVRLPPDARRGERLPTMIRFTRYGLPLPDQGGGELDLVSKNFVAVVVSVRGTGPSFGRWPVAWSPRESRDEADIVRWAARQSWSNGNVGTHGISYDGGSAERAAIHDPPALRAVVPMFIGNDPYRDVAYPGGVYNRWFLEQWSDVNNVADRNPRTRPVDSDSDGRLLRQAIEQHRSNGDVALARRAEDADDRLGPSTYAQIATSTKTAALSRAGIVEYPFAAWWDSAFARGALERYIRGGVPQQLTIGPWTHGGGSTYDSLARSPRNTFLSDLGVELRDLRTRLTDGARPLASRIRYFTLGGGGWKTTKTWPPPGVRNRVMHLAGRGKLAAAAAPAFRDRYRVDPDATTGSFNRWHTTLGGRPLDYGGRAAQDAALLTYTSAPLKVDTTVTGSPVLTMRLRASGPDPSVFAYLETVAPDGKVSYVTEGQLRLVHRRQTGSNALGPVHSFRARDRRPMPRDRAVTVSVGLQPISARLAHGHRVRIAIAGSDADTFEPPAVPGAFTVSAGSLSMPVDAR